MSRFQSLFDKLSGTSKASSNSQFWSSIISFNKGNWPEAECRLWTKAVSTCTWMEKHGAENARFLYNFDSLEWIVNEASTIRVTTVFQCAPPVQTAVRPNLVCKTIVLHCWRESFYIPLPPIQKLRRFEESWAQMDLLRLLYKCERYNVALKKMPQFSAKILHPTAE